MFKPGDCIKVKTKTLNDVFGEVVFRVEEVGLTCPDCKGKDAIKFVMLGGSGPSARAGYPVIDCWQRVQRDVASGITRIMTPVEALAAVKHYAAKGLLKPGREIEM